MFTTVSVAWLILIAVFISGLLFWPKKNPNIIFDDMDSVPVTIFLWYLTNTKELVHLPIGGYSVTYHDPDKRVHVTNITTESKALVIRMDMLRGIKFMARGRPPIFIEPIKLADSIDYEKTAQEIIQAFTTMWS